MQATKFPCGGSRRSSQTGREQHSQEKRTSTKGPGWKPAASGRALRHPWRASVRRPVTPNSQSLLVFFLLYFLFSNCIKLNASGHGAVQAGKTRLKYVCLEYAEVKGRVGITTIDLVLRRHLPLSPCETCVSSFSRATARKAFHFSKPAETPLGRFGGNHHRLHKKHGPILLHRRNGWSMSSSECKVGRLELLIAERVGRKGREGGKRKRTTKARYGEESKGPK